MNKRLTQGQILKTCYNLYVILFLVYLFAPLSISLALAFNDHNVPTLPWKGFTVDWFYDPSGARIGVFNDSHVLRAFVVSLKIGSLVAMLSLIVGTTNAFVFERENFPGRQFLYFIMIAPLVIPGIILGVSILITANLLIPAVKAVFPSEAARLISKWLRPGHVLVSLGQFSFIVTLSTLIISARLRKFSISLEEAAMDMGANRFTAIATVTIPFLMPSMIGAGIVSFLLSFENFNTTLMLTGADPTLPILLFSRLRFSDTPQISAISVLLMGLTGGLGIASIFIRRRGTE